MNRNCELSNIDFSNGCETSPPFISSIQVKVIDGKKYCTAFRNEGQPLFEDAPVISYGDGKMVVKAGNNEMTFLNDSFK